MKTSWLAFSAFLVCGCTGSAVNVLTKAERTYDFAHHRTYKWASAQLSETLPAQAVEPADLDARIRKAVDEGLAERGFRPSDSPDLLVAYRVHASERIPASDDPPPAAWDPSTDITKYAQAALVVDLIEAQSNERVWRGAAITDVQRGQGRKHVENVVNQLLKDFPPKP